MIAKDATNEMRRSEAMRMAAAHGRRRRRPQSTSKTTAGTREWRTRLHTQTEGWSPRMVWTWHVRPE